MTLDDAWTDGPRATACSPSTRPVSAGNERFDADLVRRVAGPLLDGGGVPGRPRPRARARRRRRPGQFDMTAFSLRLTNGANAVSQLHAETANDDLARRHRPRRSWASPTASTARPGSAQPIAELLEDLGADLDDLDAEHRAGRFWERLERIPARDLWEAHLRQKRELALFARGRLRSQFARHGEAPVGPRRARGRARSRRPDDRLRPPVRDLQAGRPAVQRHRPPGPDAVGRGAAGPDRLRRQGPPGRPTRPAGHPGDLPALALAAAPRPGLHPRGLRHAGRPLPRPGRRRLAQQPAPAARGVGHVGHEGGPERRPQRQRPRRLVGRGLRRRQRLGDRRPRDATPTRPPRTGATRRTSTGSSRRRSSRPTTSATRTGLPPRWLAVMRRAMATALWRFSTTRMLHEYTEQLYLPAAGVPVVEAEPTPLVTEAG